MELVRDIKFAIDCGKEVKFIKEIKNEFHFHSEGVGYWVLTKEEAQEVFEIMPNENPVVTITDMKSKGTKYEITYKGQTVSRTTKRNYTHVIIANTYMFRQNGELVELGFCGRHDLAVKKYEQYRINNVTTSKFYEDETYRKPENLEEIKNKKLWENLQIVELV